MAKLSILGYTDTLQHHSHGSKHNNKPTTQFCQIHFPATIVSSQPPYFLLSCVFKMFNMCFTSEASASILRDDRKRVTNMNNETTVSRWSGLTSPPQMTSRREVDGSSRPVNIFSRPQSLQYPHKYTIFF